ncbi:prefoldin subunit 2 [Pectinophora gossypiella]|uniref:Prefoldin subunit 2 n=1 Tax=Pectinophora gossypiella TaxID=13191 RepID=A0A1E1WBX3_PECGO|nr:prefoldin subunit 2 [Pectinophora gossypiella]
MAKPAPKAGKKTNEEIFAGFQNLRAEQRQLANKISELEMDLNEHKIVIETLKGVDTSRKCFRMIGGVLVERTVAEVLPELESNRERLPAALEALHKQLSEKGQEINEYIETHDIRVQRGDRAPSEAPEQPAAKSNVLVASN